MSAVHQSRASTNAGVSPLATTAPPPARIGKYDIEAEIGSGSLVRVFRGFDRDTGRPVTLKAPTRAADRRLIERFRREVVTAARVRHRNVIAIYELGEHGGLPFAAMQSLEGDDLRQALDGRRALTLLHKVTLMQQVAEGMQAAHRGGLIYIGLRPSAIALSSDGSVTIQDFSIVRLIGEEQDEYASYAAPEELADETAPDSLCDVFAFATIYYELLTGRHPGFEPAPLRALAPDCPEALERLIGRALDRDRKRRYQSADDLQFENAPIQSGLRRARVANLLADARRLKYGGDLAALESAVQEALELEPDNRKARQLRIWLRMEREHRALESRLADLFRQADEDAAARRLGHAVQVLNLALHLDGSNPEVKRRLEEMCRRLEHSQAVAELVAEARNLLIQESLEEARGKASEALRQDPDSPEAAEVLDVIAQAIERREREARIEQALAKAHLLLRENSVADAISLLTALQAEFPGSAAVTERLAEAQEQKAALEREAAERAERALRALEEVQWLLDQNRPDLAAAFLREKCAELSGQTELSERLAAVEQMLPAWEERRAVQDCLGRATTLDQLQQPAVALTMVEQALESWPHSKPLLEAAGRLRHRLRQEEYRKKLARRLELIGQKMSAQAWPQAMALVESGRLDFAGEPELERLLEEARAGWRRSESEGIIADVRKLLADGETEQAEAALRNGLRSVGEEPSLLSLWGEVDAGKAYRRQWREAQTLFSRGQFREAEQILATLAAQDRPEARALLETVREARAAKEEDGFYNRGRDQAIKLIEQRQFEPAIDLLRNLLSLFPGDPILERDLKLAQRGVEQSPARTEPAPASGGETNEGEQPAQASAPSEGAVAAERPAEIAWQTVLSPGASPPARFRWHAIAMASLLLLVSASAAVWTFSHRPVPASSAGPSVIPAARQTSPALKSQARYSVAPTSLPATFADVKKRADDKKPQAARIVAAPPRSFQPPMAQDRRGDQSPASVLPPPPVTDPVAQGEAPILPAGPAHTLAPPPVAEQPTRVAPAPNSLPKQAAETPRIGGNFQEPKLIRNPAPVVPSLGSGRRRPTGMVKLEVTIDERGSVSHVVILSGDPVLAAAAKRAVLDRQYQPGTLNGRPVEAKMQINFSFEGAH